MLLFDDSKKLEKALGEEAAAALAHIFERADDKWKNELATKADLIATKSDLKEDIAAVRVEMQAMKHDILRWMMGGFIAQAALLVAVMAFLR